MFRIECYCDDKRLGDVLQALKGLIHKDPSIMPVGNAEVVNGQVKATGDGSMHGALAHHIAKHRLKEIRPAEVRAFLKTAGWSPGSATYCLNEAVKHGLLRRVGQSSSTKYVVRPVKS